MSAKRMSFAEKLKAVRRRDGYSQATAAELIAGLSTRSLQAWESGRQSPPLWAQALVLEALGGAPYDPAAKKRKVSPARKVGRNKTHSRRMKAVFKYKCLGCGTLFEKKRAHGCLNETLWKSIKRGPRITEIDNLRAVK